MAKSPISVKLLGKLNNDSSLNVLRRQLKTTIHEKNPKMVF